MKVRTGMVSNSSSTAFIITNNTGDVKRMVDFARDVDYLVGEFNRMYDASYSIGEFIESADTLKDDIVPGDNYMIFGDADDTVIGDIFDYMLRNGGSSENFSWRFAEFLR